MQEGELRYVSHSLYRAIGGLAYGLFRIPRCGRVDSPAPHCGRHLLDRAFRARSKRRVRHNCALPARGSPRLTGTDRGLRSNVLTSGFFCATLRRG